MDSDTTSVLPNELLSSIQTWVTGGDQAAPHALVPLAGVSQRWRAVATQQSNWNTLLTPALAACAISMGITQLGGIAIDGQINATLANVLHLQVRVRQLQLTNVQHQDVEPLLLMMASTDPMYIRFEYCDWQGPESIPALTRFLAGLTRVRELTIVGHTVDRFNHLLAAALQLTTLLTLRIEGEIVAVTNDVLADFRAPNLALRRLVLADGVIEPDGLFRAYLSNLEELVIHHVEIFGRVSNPAGPALNNLRKLTVLKTRASVDLVPQLVARAPNLLEITLLAAEDRNYATWLRNLLPTRVFRVKFSILRRKLFLHPSLKVDAFQATVVQNGHMTDFVYVRDRVP